MARQKRKEAIAGYLFIAPLMIGLFVFYIYSFFQNFIYSFTNKKSFGIPKVIGIDNYIKMFNDKKFFDSLWHTFQYVIICVPVIVILSVLLAVLLNSSIKGKSIYRTLIFLPAVTMPAAIGLLWKWLMNYEFGIINSFFRFLNLPPIAWLSDPNFVIFSVSIVLIWSNVSYQMVIVLAGLQGISKSYYEAAEIDGAGSIDKFFSITLPLLSPTIFFVVTMSIINVFQIFDFIYLMIPQNGSGNTAARSLVSYFFEETFIKSNKGYGAAISMVLFVIIMIVTAIQFKFQRKWVYYE